jgi:hypothetical protein
MEDSQKGKGALDAYLNLFNLITMAWVAIALGQLVFSIIDKFYDSEFIGMAVGGRLKFGIASLIVITPIFLVIISNLHRKYKEKILNPASGIYKWLTYLILLISALTILGYLIGIIFQFLDGEHTISTLLKALTVLVIAGCIFGYYWYDLKRTNYAKPNQVSTIFFVIVIVVALVSIIGGLFLVDSPQTARMHKMDRERVNDLNNISYMLDNHYRENAELPVDLSAARFSKITDPETKMAYEYVVLNSEDGKYQLCTTFDLEASENDRDMGAGNDWEYHLGGYRCFDATASDSKPGLIREPTMIR